VQAQRTTSAFVSFGCDFNHVLYSGCASAEAEIDPYGIGVSVGVFASGNNFTSEPPLAAAASASFSWAGFGGVEPRFSAAHWKAQWARPRLLEAQRPAASGARPWATELQKV